MKRKYILLLLLAILNIISCKDSLEGKSTHEKISKLPKIKGLLLDSITPFSTKNLPDDKVTLITFFDPTCPHCKDEIKGIFNNLSFFMHCNLVFMTSSKPSEIKSENLFPDNDLHKNVYIVQDTDTAFTKIYDGFKLPMTALYDKEDKLYAVFRGYDSISSLIEQVKRVQKL